jgi:hypothetical protein
MISDDLSANLCDGLVTVLQKHSAILKSGVLGIGNIVNPTAIAVKRKRLTKKRKRLTNIHHQEEDKVHRIYLSRLSVAVQLYEMSTAMHNVYIFIYTGYEN